jgi:hypothetical protein
MRKAPKFVALDSSRNLTGTHGPPAPAKIKGQSQSIVWPVASAGLSEKFRVIITSYKLIGESGPLG